MRVYVLLPGCDQKGLGGQTALRQPFAKIWASEARVSCPRGDGEVVLIFLGECLSALLPHAERSIFCSIVGSCCGEKVSSIAAKCWRGQPEGKGAIASQGRERGGEGGEVWIDF